MNSSLTQKKSADAPAINNYKTVQIGRVDSTTDLTPEELAELRAKVEPQLTHENKLTWDANINGVLVRLVTNSEHQMDFWMDNWWPGPNDDSVRPHGFLISVNGVEGMEPHAYYCPERRTAVFVNTEYYGQCKSWALGIAAHILEHDFHTHSIHGACAEVNGKGIVLIAPTGTGKTTQVNKLFQHPKGRVIGDDWIYITHPADGNYDAPLMVTQPERSLYVRTENAEEEPWLRPIFEHCKLENVITDPDECHHEEGEPCQILDGGKPYCLWGFGNSRAIIPREKMKGPGKVADEAPMDLIVLLRRDDESPACEELTAEEAVEVLREGRTLIRPGAGPREKWGTYKSEPWYNPYLLVPDDDVQTEYFRRACEQARTIIINTGAEGESIQRSYERILSYLGESA